MIMKVSHPTASQEYVWQVASGEWYATATESRFATRAEAIAATRAEEARIQQLISPRG